MWWEGPDFMGRQENVQSFVVSSIGWRKIPTVLQPHPVLPIPLKDTLQFLALVVQALHMACLVNSPSNIHTVIPQCVEDVMWGCNKCFHKLY